jgi:hypothetical protein
MGHALYDFIEGSVASGRKNHLATLANRLAGNVSRGTRSGRGRHRKGITGVPEGLYRPL